MQSIILFVYSVFYHFLFKSGAFGTVTADNFVRRNASDDLQTDAVGTDCLVKNIIERGGGSIPFVEISAKTGVGIDNLLDTLLAISEMEELKANPNRYAVGTVIESRVDKNIGGVATLLIQNGTLRLGDPIVVGTAHGRVRTFKNDLHC